MPLAFALLVSTAIGAVVVWMLAPRPRTLGTGVLQACLAIGTGVALCSVPRLLAMALFSWTDKSLAGMELAMLAGALVLSLVTARSGPSKDFGTLTDPLFATNANPPSRRARALAGFMLIVVIAAGVLSADAFGSFGRARPHGNWDAWAMWNMKARYFYLGGEQWNLAVCNEVSGVRPDYPFLLPLSVARLWAYEGNDSVRIPFLTAAMFTALIAVTLFAAVARIRGLAGAALACLVLFGSRVLVDEGASQYADTPLTFYILASVVVCAAAQSAGYGSNRLWAMAGLMSGCAAWTKNEGQLFCAALGASCVIVSWRQSGLRTALRRFLMFVLGASPLLACVVGTKLAFVWRNDVFENQTASGALQLLTDPDRYRQVGRLFMSLLPESIYPALLVLLVVYAICSIAAARIGNGEHRGESRAGLLVAAPALALMAAGYAFIYLITPHDLEWHMRTSLSRLILHLWPSALFVLFLVLPRVDRHTAAASTRGAARPCAA